jgi:glycopeptide antibiotics resistance protein
MKKIFNRIAWLALILYLALLFDLVFFRYRIHFTSISESRPFSEYLKYSSNFKPFDTICHYLSNIGNINIHIIITNILGNIAAFIPYGLLLPVVLKFNKIRLMLLHSFSLSLLIEVIQMIFRVGSFDVDDILLNTLGGFLGFMLLRFIRESFKEL